MEQRVSTELEGETHDAISGEQELQTRTTEPACLDAARGTEEGVHRSVEH
jgi:hypothetical protein